MIRTSRLKIIIEGFLNSFCGDFNQDVVADSRQTMFEKDQHMRGTIQRCEAFNFH